MRTKRKSRGGDEVTFILENFSLPFLALEKEEIYEGKPVRVWNGEGDAESFVR